MRMQSLYVIWIMCLSFFWSDKEEEEGEQQQYTTHDRAVKRAKHMCLADNLQPSSIAKSKKSARGKAPHSSEHSMAYHIPAGCPSQGPTPS